MKIYKKICLSLILSTSLFALPEEGQLVVPQDIDNQQMENANQDQNFSQKNNDVKKNIQKNNNNSNNSDDIIKILDEANKKKLEYESMKNKQKELDKQNDKDYVLEQSKKDNDIYDEKLKKITNDEKYKQKEKDIKNLSIDETEQYHDAIKSKLETLKDVEKNFSNEYRVDGIYTLKILGDKKTILIPSLSLYEAIDRLVLNKRDIDNVRNQIKFYETALKSKNKEYLKELKDYEELYKKTDITTLKSTTTETSKTELQDGDFVYQNIYITNISKNSYTLVMK